MWLDVACGEFGWALDWLDSSTEAMKILFWLLWWSENFCCRFGERWINLWDKARKMHYCALNLHPLLSWKKSNRWVKFTIEPWRESVPTIETFDLNNDSGSTRPVKNSPIIEIEQPRIKKKKNFQFDLFEIFFFYSMFAYQILLFDSSFASTEHPKLEKYFLNL